ncbi:hypothetical protein ACIPXV_27375 [Streptomyces libani]|uniref:hypothetical protein n=1 Tax=Streptomyces TaxID=1883 RepID=UPI00380C9010
MEMFVVPAVCVEQGATHGAFQEEAGFGGDPAGCRIGDGVGDAQAMEPKAWKAQ